jgi:hypothetical protein
VSAYEDCAWAGSSIKQLDKETDGAVDALVTRADGQRMAIEHTLIEPFVGDKRDYAMFEQAFLVIENDSSLAVQDTGITVYVPVGILDGKVPTARNTIIASTRSGLAGIRLQLREGKHDYQCDIAGMSAVTVMVHVSRFRNSRPRPGSVLIRRQQVKNDLDEVVCKALRKKLPKLAKTEANRRLLLLERDQFSFMPELIFDEIERQRSSHPLLALVDELWQVETIGYKPGGHLYFDRWICGKQALTSMTFADGELTGYCRDGLPRAV